MNKSAEGTSDQLRILTEAIEINPLGAEAYFRRALQFQGKQRIDDLSRAIAIDPSYSEAYYFRGMAYDILGNHESAIEDYTYLIKMKPQVNRYYNSRALCYYQIADYIHAIEDYTKYFSMVNPNNIKNPKLRKLKKQRQTSLWRNKKNPVPFLVRD